MCLLVSGTAWAGEKLHAFEVVERYPHDPDAFTQGLVFHGGFLYEGTGLYGHSSLRRVNLADGEVLARTELAQQFFGEGIAILGERIYQLTWREERGFVYDLATLELIEQFSYAGEGWGLTADGEYLIMSNGTDQITYLDPDSFRPVRQITVSSQEGPIWHLNELEYIDGEILANIWFDHRICRIDPGTGKVLGWIDLSSLYETEKQADPDADVVNGIAYDHDNQRLFVTGKLWSHIYEIRLER
ncbi:MAG: glutaminyl-peptide cyclotransferase [Firmicutes bacterium]|nr:glutaminyl-peptide cyclotransferase [Bacillota bacterium]